MPAIRDKVWLCVGATLAMLLVARASLGAGALSLRAAPDRILAFPDGSHLTVLGACLSSQPFTTDLPVPVTVPARPFRPGTQASVTNALWVWFTYVDDTGTNISESLDWAQAARQVLGARRAGLGWSSASPPSNLRRRPWTSIALVSKNGIRAEVGVSPMFQSVTAAGGTPICGLLLDSFPRRQREFDLQFFDKDGKSLGAVSVPNPVEGPFPEWYPERLPITRTNGPLVVTLESLTKSPEGWVTPSYRLESADPDWRLTNRVSINRSQWFDATGNTGIPPDWQEKAWKLALEFRRINPTQYSEEERFVVSGLKVPAPGTMQVLTNEFERQGMKFKFYCLAGVGTLAITNGSLSMIGSSSAPAEANAHGGYLVREGEIVGIMPRNTNRPVPPYWNTLSTAVHSVTTGRPYFLLEGSRPGAPDELHFRVVDSDGQELLPTQPPDLINYTPTLSRTPPATGPANHTYLIEFDGTKASGTVSLEVTINRPRSVEFIIDPAEVKRVR